MNFSQTQYDVFYLAREPPRTTGYIFQRASGSGRFVDIDVDDSLMDDLVSQQSKCISTLCIPLINTYPLFHSIVSRVSGRTG